LFLYSCVSPCDPNHRYLEPLPLKTKNGLRIHSLFFFCCFHVMSWRVVSAQPPFSLFISLCASSSLLFSSHSVIF
jgi:hypothetical protein